MRHEFKLPESDEDALNARALPWETIIDNGGRWLLLHELPVPNGYNHKRVTVAVRIEANYPPAPLDMAYFHPELARSDGKSIRALSPHQIEGRPYQRWSRHYKWNPAKDTLTSHLLRVEHWLEAELTQE